MIARTQQALLGHDSTQPWDVEYRVLPMAVVERDCDVYAMYVCEYFYRHKRPPEASTLPTAEELHMLRRKHLADRYEFDVWTMGARNRLPGANRTRQTHDVLPVCPAGE